MKLDIRDCMHPGDLSAINAIRGIPKFQDLLDYISKNSIEKYYKLVFCASNLRLTEKNSPLVYGIVKEACEIFGIENIPEIFICRSYDYNVNVFGVKNTIIVISTATLENLSEEQLRLYLIPYVASIAAGHNTMNFIEILLAYLGSALPIPKDAIQMPLLQWSKQKDYTYDRIRLAISGDIEETCKYIGIGETTNEIMNATTLESRIETSKKILDYDMLKSMARNAKTLTQTNAWNANRLIEIFTWYESGAYKALDDNLKKEGQA